MSDTRAIRTSDFPTHREIEACVRRAEMVRAQFIADSLSRFFKRLRGGIDHTAAPAAKSAESTGTA